MTSSSSAEALAAARRRNSTRRGQRLAHPDRLAGADEEISVAADARTP